MQIEHIKFLKTYSSYLHKMGLLYKKYNSLRSMSFICNNFFTIVQTKNTSFQ
jgi:hypothetical protein